MSHVSQYTSQSASPSDPQYTQLEQELKQLRRRLDRYEVRAAHEQRFSQIFHQASQLMVLLSTDGLLIEANQAMLDLVGARAMNPQSKCFIWQLPCWLGLTETELKQSVAAAARGETVAQEIHLRGQSAHQTDRQITIDFCLKPLHSDNGTITHLLMEGHDVTERKHAHAEVQRLNVELEQRILEQTAQLKISNCQRDEALLNEKHAQQQAELANVQIQLYINIFENLPVGLNIWQLEKPDEPTSLR
ncbi:hypothetical protein C7B61_16770, partial [filamentous cyanobacterium CCP1]